MSRMTPANMVCSAACQEPGGVAIDSQASWRLTSRSRTWIMWTPQIETPASKHDAPKTTLAVRLIVA